MPWDTSTRRSRLPSNWATLRATALARDGHRCTATTHAPTCDGRATEVHHLGADTDHRLHMIAGLSRPCHAAETAREAAQARAQRPGYTRTPEAHPGLTR